MKTHAIATESPNLGFQIAPMIDVVFVIMLFFMVMAGAIKTERILRSALPHQAAEDSVAVFPPNEVLIFITEDGVISLNDEEVAANTDVALKYLGDRLVPIHEQSAALGTQTLVTIQTEENTKYQRIVDVINVMSRVGIRNVTFAVGADE